MTQGGHDIPEGTIRKRYALGQKNLIKHYLPLADHVVIVDNLYKESKRIIAHGSQDQLEIKLPEIWQKIKQIADA